ncbi:MAG: dihydroneopterin aldolase [Flavobacteriales bacterium]|nr:dihydroneopterin aldolase [Flavobacteriales bacterium]
MGVLEVSGIRVYAYHGCLKEEGSIGGHYCVDVRLEGDMTSAETNDRLTDAIDYCQVAAIVRSQMAVRSALIENVARRVLDALRMTWPGAGVWRVRLVKEHPPVPGAVDHVVYSIEG